MISAHQAAAVGSKDPKKVLIPTPNTTELSAERYAELYPKRFEQPFTYIRSSLTVEDCSGTLYCMSETDDKYLEKLNETRKPGLAPITEDEFETIMDLYESAIQQTQPYLSMDVANIIPFEELEHAFEDTLEPPLKIVAKHIYAYWKELKINRGGRTIIPCLKFEQGEKDDGDPYVCFRRREVRQVRKTRRADHSHSDKLKKLRQEFETARGLVKDVLQREHMRRTAFLLEKQIFEQRRTTIELKRKLGIKDTDEDLINKPRRQRTEPQAPPTLRIPIRQDGKPPDADLRQLSTLHLEEETKRQEKCNTMRKIVRSISKYCLSDVTIDAVCKQADPTPKPPSSFFCSVQSHYLPSPPHSAESASSQPESNAGPMGSTVSIVQAAQCKSPLQPIPRHRRRIGRGGRIFIDRRGFSSVAKENADPIVLDRIKYDNHESDEDEEMTFLFDPFSDSSIKSRATMLSPPPDPTSQPANGMRRQQQQMMASSPLIMAPGAGNSPVSGILPNGHHPGTPHHPLMATNGTPTMLSNGAPMMQANGTPTTQVNGMPVQAFPTPHC